jgi:hypothetical protein
MASDDFDPYDFEPDIPDGYVLCPRCDGHQEVPCHCGGDLCVCENYGEKPCPLCGGEYGGEGYVPKETADKYLARQAEFAEAFRKAIDRPVTDPTDGGAG